LVFLTSKNRWCFAGKPKRDRTSICQIFFIVLTICKSIENHFFVTKFSSQKSSANSLQKAKESIQLLIQATSDYRIRQSKVSASTIKFKHDCRSKTPQ